MEHILTIVNLKLKPSLFTLHPNRYGLYFCYVISTVLATILRHFMLKASDKSVHTEANAHSADWLMRIFVNELAPPHARSQQGKCVQQC